MNKWLPAIVFGFALIGYVARDFVGDDIRIGYGGFLVVCFLLCLAFAW